MNPDTASDLITPREAGNLAGLFNKRVSRSPEATAYRYYDTLNSTWVDITWSEMAKGIQRWERALHRQKLTPGDRVAIMARNSRLWVMFDQAALGLGLVVVPVYTEDRGENVHYVLQHSGAKLLVIGGTSQWERIQGKLKGLRSLKRIISIGEMDEAEDRRLVNLEPWLSSGTPVVKRPILSPGDLATIVYTSGTTGRPKGVMLSHRNILSNVYSCAQTGFAAERENFLSFLPLSHTFERTVGYYLPIMLGATVAHSRSIQELSEDLQMVKPTGLITVPRIFERVYARLQDNLKKKSVFARGLFNFAVHVGWHRFEYRYRRVHWSPLLILWPLLKRLVADQLMLRLGGRLKIAICGGAALSADISRVFVGLGIPVFQGYGLTEASPVVSVNTEKMNIPASIGPPLPGVEVKIGEDEELLVKGENVMMGYWQDDAATAAAIDSDGWLHTGDKATMKDGHLFITGRIKDIIVLANGEKVSPVDMEMSISSDPLFEQVLIIGESQPFLAALLVLDESRWKQLAAENDLDESDKNSEAAEQRLLERLSACLQSFPGYARVRHAWCVDEPWTVENDLLTPTLKAKRNRIMELYREQIDAMYESHGERRTETETDQESAEKNQTAAPKSGLNQQSGGG